MELQVMVRADGSGRYTAQSVALPLVMASGDSEEAAIDQLRVALAKWATEAKVVRVAAPAGTTGNPWLDHIAGSSADDPQFQEYLDAIRKAREEFDRVWQEGEPA